MKPQFDERNVQICGVSFDDVKSNHSFREKFAFPFPLLCDTDKQLGLACGAADDKSSANAKRVSVVISPDGKVAKFYGTVKAAEHPQQILDEL